jgi:regulatory LuxR family protein
VTSELAAQVARAPQAALAAGVRGFLPKTVSAQVLADVVRTVHRGGRYVDPELAADAISGGDSPLTPCEADVLELAAGGAAVEEIAQRAALSPGTVRNYLSAPPPSSAPATAMRQSNWHAPAAGSDRPGATASKRPPGPHRARPACHLCPAISGCLIARPENGQDPCGRTSPES